MNLNEFVNQYLGKATDYDGVCGTQCVDLIKLYLDKVFGIKAGAWGNAKYYWLDFEKRPQLKAGFKKINNTPSLVPKRGDIVVWSGELNNNCGHVAIATGEGDTHQFYTYDQNWNEKSMQKVKHTYKYVYGVLRPLDQAKVEEIKKEDDFEVRTWKNGSTKEIVYADTAKTMKIGELAPREACSCYGKVDNMYIVAYKVNGKASHKTGFVAYHG